MSTSFLSGGQPASLSGLRDDKSSLKQQKRVPPMRPVAVRIPSSRIPHVAKLLVPTGTRRVRGPFYVDRSGVLLYARGGARTHGSLAKAVDIGFRRHVYSRRVQAATVNDGPLVLPEEKKLVLPTKWGSPENLTRHFRPFSPQPLTPGSLRRYCEHVYQTVRRPTRTINVGKVQVGSEHPVALQVRRP